MYKMILSQIDNDEGGNYMRRITVGITNKGHKITLIHHYKKGTNPPPEDMSLYSDLEPIRLAAFVGGRRPSLYRKFCRRFKKCFFC